MEKRKVTTDERRSISEEQKAELMKKLDIGTVWNPEVGETIMGYVDEFKNHSGKYGGKKTETRLCILEVDGVKRVIWLKSVLEARFEELEIKIGDFIAIQYKGKPDKKKYHVYTVAKL